MGTSRAVLAVLAAGAVLSAVPSEAAGPFQYHTVTPCRLADTRNLPGPSGGPILVDNTTRSFPVQGLCGIPVGAKAVSVNVTAVAPNGAGFLTLFPSGIAVPLISSLNFNAGETAIGNGAIVVLADQTLNPLDLSIYTKVTGSGSVHMVLDVTGFFQ
jgi:hypothetical protein